MVCHQPKDEFVSILAGGAVHHIVYSSKFAPRPELRHVLTVEFLGGYYSGRVVAVHGRYMNKALVLYFFCVRCLVMSQLGEASPFSVCSMQTG